MVNQFLKDGVMAHKIRTHSNNKLLVENRRDQLAKKALPLFIKKGFKATTIRDIAKACGMTHGAIYYYLGKKEDIMSLVLQGINAGTYETLKEIEEVTKQSSPKEALAWAIDRYYRHHDKIKVESVFIVSNYMFFSAIHRLHVVEIHTKTVDVFENILKRGCHSGDFNVEDPWLCAFEIVEIGQIWAQRQHILANKYTLDKYIAFYTDQIMSQITTKGSVGRVKRA